MNASDQSSGQFNSSPMSYTLQWWPAALLLVAMVLLRKLPDTMEAPSLPIFMLGFMGPAALAILVLLRADTKSMVELAKFPAIEGKTWNHSVVVGNHVFIRNAEQAACYELPTR